jgi:hypothetical protein
MRGLGTASPTMRENQVRDSPFAEVVEMLDFPARSARVLLRRRGGGRRERGKGVVGWCS